MRRLHPIYRARILLRLKVATSLVQRRLGESALEARALLELLHRTFSLSDLKLELVDRVLEYALERVLTVVQVSVLYLVPSSNRHSIIPYKLIFR